MDKNTHLNYLALNQNILGKTLRVGSGPVEGDEINPIKTYEGLKIYLNGKHNLSEFTASNFELDELISFGDIIHPYAMGDHSYGKIKYELGTTEKYFCIVVRLKLDEDEFGKSDEAFDILSLIKKSEIPNSYNYGTDQNYFLAREMLLCHFEYLFEFYKSYDELIKGGWEINEELAIVEIVKYFFELKQAVDDIDNELSKG